MVEIKVSKDEIEELEKLVKKIENKATINQFGIFIGGLVCLLALVYFMMNPEIIAGSISILVIGILILILNLISYKQRKKRIVELSKDVNTLKKLYDQQYN